MAERKGQNRGGWTAGLWAVMVAGAVLVPIVIALTAVDNARVARSALRLALAPPPAATAEQAFDRIGFNVRELRQAPQAVPRVLLASLPAELASVTNAGQRKALFLTAMLPLVLQVNEIIRAERERLVALIAMTDAGKALSVHDREWLRALQKKYRVGKHDFEKLLRRVNIIPPSLTLAQAAIESGWGTSRFAQEGNALFGQWTWDEDGMIPLARPDGSNHRIKTFDHLIESVAAYARNLNTHPAYATMREIRAELAENGRVITGPSLVPGLHAYSERRDAYIRDLNAIIRGNRLIRFDGAALEYSALRQEPASADPDIVAAR